MSLLSGTNLTKTWMFWQSLHGPFDLYKACSVSQLYLHISLRQAIYYIEAMGLDKLAEINWVTLDRKIKSLGLKLAHHNGQQLISAISMGALGSAASFVDSDFKKLPNKVKSKIKNSQMQARL
ncbi:hypothetical protein L2737_16910 [Shewanella electrodiphila]|uniref:Uncharacterized protein n=1 Tax=Shewanella electrodiphila TaxID=934143 RepID=A0ABT0KSY9_9GAMM|nr:hypothetical protein [Shewanella electrodiphila]MCL1046981.1 hypothetical protein [Shewanella electrodiphila]